jgi:hyaluronan synthase
MQVETTEQAPGISAANVALTLGRLGDWVLYGAIVAALAALVFVNLHHALWRPMFLAAEEHAWTRLLVLPGILWVGMGILLLAFRTALWLRYRPYAAATMEDAPPLTVIIPAYNEGAMVMKSIESVAQARYPNDRLEIFVVDDGSKDDTWEHISRAAARFPALVRTIRFPRNQGKRAALAAGFAQAQGEVIVTLDSDSVIERDALLAIAGPFRDPAVGAVAGKVEVYNRHEGLLPRMLHVRYVLSFDVLRAAESSYGTVYCCPGALSGYRKAVVGEVLDDWLGQKFLGARCTFGEDRALTNFILSRGYNTVYQRTARVRTIVPAAYAKLCKMFIRWDRSYVREELRFLRIVWKRPAVPRVIAFWDRFVTNTRYPVNYASLALFALLVRQHPDFLFRFLVAVGLTSLLYTIYYLRSERSLDFLYGIVYSYFALFTLFWIFPYAALTVRARSWLTR